MPTPTELRANADAKFKKKEFQRQDGCAAMTEYEAASRATAEKTARLRALRLSREVTPSPMPAELIGKRQPKKRAGRVVPAV